jgi:predicted glycoside hydrolase/deacetylase ChbG (UPF0249 family)
MPAELAAPMADVGSALLEQFNPRRPDAFHAGFFGRSATKAELLRILGGLPAGTSELMCHPGRVDSALLEGSSYARPRQRELEILTDPEVRASVDALGLRLISFAEM